MLQPECGSVKAEFVFPDSSRGVQRNPAIMCDFGFGFRQKTGFGSKLVPFILRTSSEPQLYRQFGQWSILAGCGDSSV